MANFISKWLVLGPIYSKFHQDVYHPEDPHPGGAEIIRDIDDSSFWPEQVTGTLEGAPQEGDVVSYYSSIFPKADCSWRALEFAGVDWENVAEIGDNIHNKLHPDFKEKHHALVFLLTYLEAADDCTVRLLVRSDDSRRVWLNGAEVEALKCEGESAIDGREAAADLKIQRGTNILLAAVADTHLEWGFSCRLENSHGLTFSRERPLVVLPGSVSRGKKVHKGLDEVSTDYTVFEKDQVLTHDQLNSVSRYLDGQERLTRVNLLGVGVAQGFSVSLKSDGSVKIGKGVGITSDGDLLNLGSDLSFRHFRNYDASRPRYAPFYRQGDVAGRMYPVYELLAAKDAAAPAAGVGSLADLKELEDMVAVLYLESYLTDLDICSATDCDNLGQQCRNALKVLLINRADADQLKEDKSLQRGSDLSTGLPEIVPERVVLSPAATDYLQFSAPFMAACLTLKEAVSGALDALGANSGDYLGDDFADRGKVWTGRLAEIQSEQEKTCLEAHSIQYYYHFLKDLAQTYNSLRELLLRQVTSCCPPFASFPKHLLLGPLSAGDGAYCRNPFYPSPLLRESAEELEQVRFLFRKIERMLSAFQVPAATGIRLTPSLAEGSPLEEKAIPFYYNLSGQADSLQNFWSYRLRKPGAPASLYSYNFAAYGGRTLGAKTPLPSFYRVEGHVGMKIADAVRDLKKLSVELSLPFAVRALVVGAERERPPLYKPPIRYGDLHRLHFLLRQDIYHQLGEVVHFSSDLKKKITKAVGRQEVVDSAAATDRASVKLIAKQKDDTVSRNALSARGKLQKGYSAYKEDLSWKEDLKYTLKAAGEYKYDFSHVVETTFTTPFDSLIGSTHTQWLDWLDKIIDQKERRQDQRLFLTRFQAEHPGLEAQAGVPSGGTFILLYDAKGVVVADLCLPYFLCEPDEEEDDQKKTTRPGVKPRFVLESGIRVIPSLETKLTDFEKTRMDPLVSGKVDAFMKDKLKDLVSGKFDELKGGALEELKGGLSEAVTGMLNKFKANELDSYVKPMLEDLQKSMNRHFEAQSKLTLAEMQNDLNKKFEAQSKDNFAALTSSLSAMAGALGSKGALSSKEIAPQFSDIVLNESLVDIREKQQVLHYLNSKAKVDVENRERLAKQADEVAGEIGEAIVGTARYIESLKDISAGSETLAAMDELKNGLDAIQKSPAISGVTGRLADLQKESSKTFFKAVVGSMVKRYV